MHVSRRQSSQTLLCRRTPLSLLIALAASLSALQARAGVYSYAVARTVSYTQSSDTQPTTPEYWNTLAVLFYDVPNEVLSATLEFTVPPPVSYDLYQSTPTLHQYSSAFFTSESTFLADFPETIYTLAADRGAGIETGTVFVPADLYCPQIPYFTGDTFSRLQGCNSSVAFNVTINGFTLAPGTNGGHCLVAVVRESPPQAVLTLVLDASDTAFEIPAGSLEPSTNYSISISYLDYVRTENAGFGMAASEAEYFRSTTSYFTTADPSECPTIDTQPANQTVPEGEAATFTVVAAGTAPLTYQWRRGATPLLDGGNISGATTATLTIDPAGPADADTDYNVVVTNLCGSVVSDPATLSVSTGPLLGDMNCDGFVDMLDVPLFSTALVNPAEFTGCDITRGDMNLDTQVDGRDIGLFVSAIVGP